MKRNNLLTLIIIGIAIVIVAVIYNSMDRLEYEDTDPVVSNVIEIRFSSSWAGIDSKAPFLETVISEFEATYPNIRIINESMYGEDFLFTLKADFASGNGPDVFGLWPGSDLELLIENGLIADLSPILIDDQIWSDNFDPQVFEFLDQGYQTFSIPFEVIYEGLYINEDLFEAYGVTIPEDFDELLVAIEVFKNADIIPIAYNLTPEGSFIYQNLIVQLAGKYDTENPIKRDGSIKPGYVEAMYKMKELYDRGAFPDDAFTLNDAARNNLFIEKKAAMIAQGSWFNSEKLDETIGIIPFPINTRHKTAIIYGIGNGNFHLTKAAYEDPIRKDAALLFLKYLTSEKSREIFNSSPSFISTSSAVPTGYLNRIGLDLTHQADELVGPPDHYINRNFWESILIKEFPNMLEGKITPEAIFKKLEDY